MINVLVYALFALVLTMEWLVNVLELLPRVVALSPEIISAFAMVIVALRLGRDREIIIPPKYILWFGMMVLVIVAGIAVSTVQPGAAFAGLRTYFRYAPIFLLPIVYHFSDDQIKKQLKFLLFFALLQFPVTAHQKITAPNASGDHMVGTIGVSSLLSIFLICAIAMLTALLVKKTIRLKHYIPLTMLLFLPTTLNETTGTLFLLPLAFVLPVILAPGQRNKLRLLIPIGAFGALVIGIFVVTYNTEYGDRWGGNVGASIFEGGAIEFLYRGATSDTTTRDAEGSMAAIGRLDSVVMPFRLDSDPVTLTVGNGIGNVSKSFHELLDGDMAEQAVLYGVDFTAATKLLWELGVIGLALSFLFYWFIFSDARTLAARQDFSGAIALGWASVIPILAASMFYRNITDSTVIGYTMWYMSGYIVGKRCELLRRQMMNAPDAVKQPPTRTTFKRPIQTLRTRPHLQYPSIKR